MPRRSRDSGVRCAKSAIGNRHLTTGRPHTPAGARRHVDNLSGLGSAFDWRRTLNSLRRLDRFGRHSVRKDLALPVHDRLAIERKRILCALAQTVKQAVRVGGRGGQSGVWLRVRILNSLVFSWRTTVRAVRGSLRDADQSSSARLSLPLTSTARHVSVITLAPCMRF